MAQALTISAHVERCEKCQEDIDLFERVGGALVEQLAEVPLDPGALGRAIVELNAPQPEAPRKVRPAPKARVALPTALAEVGVGPRRWLAPGMWVARAKAEEINGWRTFLVCLPAGGRIPAHCHNGGELVCVIDGSFNDGTTWFHDGDFAEADAEVEHEITVALSGPCLCMVSTQAPIQWRGWAKLLSPFVGI